MHGEMGKCRDDHDLRSKADADVEMDPRHLGRMTKQDLIA